MRPRSAGWGGLDSHQTSYKILDTMARIFRMAWALVALGGIAAGAVDRIEITSRKTIGSYERIIGRAYYSVDPKLPQNRAIADIGLAPVNARGRVEFSGDFMILRPLKKSRGSVFLEVVNRGISEALLVLDGGGSNDPDPERWSVG